MKQLAEKTAVKRPTHASTEADEAKRDEDLASRDAFARVIPASLSTGALVIFLYWQHAAQHDMQLRFGSTNYFWETLLAVLSIGVNAVRYTYGQYVKRNNLLDDRKWIQFAQVTVPLSGLFFGLFAWAQLSSDQIFNLDDVLTAIAICGVAAGATNALSPKPGLARLYIASLVLPTIIGAALTRDGEYQRLAVFFFMTMLYLFGQIRILHKQSIELRRANKAATEQRMRMIFEQNPFPSQIVGRDGSIRMVNSAWTKLWDLTPEQSEAIVKTMNLLNDQDIQRFETAQNLRRALSGERVKTKILEIDPSKLGREGSISYIESYMNPIETADGQINEALLMFRDVTDDVLSKRRIEESELEKSQALVREKTALEASKMKSEFLANMSHEIRTPINGVIGMLGLVQEGPLTEDQKQFAQTAHRSASSLLTVINDILDLAKVEAGKFELENADFEIRTIFEDLNQLFRPIAFDKNLDFSVTCDPLLPSHLHGDTNRIRQIVTNFVGNSVKFTEVGEVVVHVALASETTDAVEILIEVKDTGIGIPNEMRERLFKPFQQANSSNSRRYGGSGLGLSISRSLAHLMDGEVGCDSEIGRGSKFWFRFSLQRAKKTVSAEQKLDLIQIRSANQGARVLIAEDNQVNQIITRRILEKMGLEVEIAANGVEAVAMTLVTDYDLIVMDCQMPEMDGFEATRQIRKFTDARKNQIPIIGFTAGAMQSDRDACMSSGMTDYLSKPAKFENFVVTLRPHLVQRRLTKTAV